MRNIHACPNQLSNNNNEPNFFCEKLKFLIAFIFLGKCFLNNIFRGFERHWRFDKVQKKGPFVVHCVSHNKNAGVWVVYIIFSKSLGFFLKPWHFTNYRSEIDG
jgi:hypothetical protein